MESFANVNPWSMKFMFQWSSPMSLFSMLHHTKGQLRNPLNTAYSHTFVSMLHDTNDIILIQHDIAHSSLFSTIPIVGFEYFKFLRFRLYALQYQWHDLNTARYRSFVSIFHNTYGRLWILQVLKLSSLCSPIPMACSKYSTFSRFPLYSPQYL